MFKIAIYREGRLRRPYTMPKHSAVCSLISFISWSSIFLIGWWLLRMKALFLTSMGIIQCLSALTLFITDDAPTAWELEYERVFGSYTPMLLDVSLSAGLEEHQEAQEHQAVEKRDPGINNSCFLTLDRKVSVFPECLIQPLWAYIHRLSLMLFPLYRRKTIRFRSSRRFMQRRGYQRPWSKDLAGWWNTLEATLLKQRLRNCCSRHVGVRFDGLATVIPNLLLLWQELALFIYFNH